MPAASETQRNLRELVLLRYVLIVAVSYLVVSQHDTSGVSMPAAMLVATALASNVLLGRLRPSGLGSPRITGVIVIADTIWLSLSLALIGHLGTEFFFLYFFVLFFAALADNLVLMLLGVVGASAAYLWVLARLHPGAVWTQAHLLQITFLFSAALFYGALVKRSRHRRHEAEVMEAADRERTQLLATLAHDIGGPAHAISFGIETLEHEIEERTAPHLHALLGSIVRSSRYLTELAERFIEYSRARAGRCELRPTAVSIATVVAHVAAEHQLDARERNVTLALVVGSIPTVLLDELALARTLHNLIANALRYSAAGATVTVEAELEGDTIRIAVRDTGAGMSHEQSERLGQPFTADGAQGGSGLGLFIVRSLIEAQGGSLTTSSEEGTGTVVTMRLPFVEPEAARASA